MLRKASTYTVTVEEKTDSTGTPIVQQIWQQTGREDSDSYNPTVTVRHRDTGMLLYEGFCFGGVLHRLNGPASSQYAEDGRLVNQSWMQKGVLHREGAPAEFYWDEETGVLIEEAYYQFGELHRTDGPALIERDALSGKITAQAWYISGSEIDENEFAAMVKCL